MTQQVVTGDIIPGLHSSHARSRKDAKRLVRIGLPLVAVVIAGLGGLGARHLIHASLAPEFACISPGVLYRSGQPDGGDLKELVALYGIKTVVNLRGSEKTAARSDGAAEIAFAREHNIHLVFQHYGASGDVMKEVRDFLRLVSDPVNQPVLVHCAEGKERSGVMAAAYRIVVEGWPGERALAEAESFGLKPVEKPEMVAVIRECDRQRAELRAEISK